VVYLEGRVRCTDVKNENDVSIGLIRLSALAMLSNGKASGLVRKAILAKKKSMPRIEEEEVEEVEPVKTTIQWEDEGATASAEEEAEGGEETSEAEEGESTDFGGEDGEDGFVDQAEEQQQQQQRKKRFWTGRRLLETHR